MTPRDLSKNYITTFPNDSTAIRFDKLTELYVILAALDYQARL